MSKRVISRRVHTVGFFALCVERLGRELEASEQAREKLSEVIEVWKILVREDFTPYIVVNFGRDAFRPGYRRYSLKYKSLVVSFSTDNTEVYINHGYFEDQVVKRTLHG